MRPITWHEMISQFQILRFVSVPNSQVVLLIAYNTILIYRTYFYILHQFYVYWIQWRLYLTWDYDLILIPCQTHKIRLVFNRLCLHIDFGESIFLLSCIHEKHKNLCYVRHKVTFVPEDRNIVCSELLCYYIHLYNIAASPLLLCHYKC